MGGDIIRQVEKSYTKGSWSGAFRYITYHTWNRVINRVGSRLPRSTMSGENVYNDDWDALIILDACRPDALSMLASEYEFVPSEIPTMKSAGPTSPIWLANTFTEATSQDLAGTSLVSANVYTKDLGEIATPPDTFNHVVEVWRDGWDDELDSTPPREVTRSAVEAHRQLDHDRIIVHYMQPHMPYPSLDFKSDAQGWSVWNELKCGGISRFEAFGAYLDTLRWVLDDVALLLSACDFDSPVISADHTELFGEYGLYGHHPFPIPFLHRVPWVELDPDIYGSELQVDDDELEDVRSAPSDSSAAQQDNRIDTQQQLRALGYRT